MTDLTSISVSKLQNEQKQELFEAIRHFNKYRAFGNLEGCLPIPELADKIIEDIIKLYEHVYEIGVTND